MTEVMVIQGRELHTEDIGLIRSLLAEHGGWCRTRINEELCRRWDWRNEQGRFKDMAALTLLLFLYNTGARVQEAALKRYAPAVLAKGFACKPPWHTDSSLMAWPQPPVTVRVMWRVSELSRGPPGEPPRPTTDQERA